MRDCYNLVEDFNLQSTHCSACHIASEQGDSSYPIEINGIVYKELCCDVVKELINKKIKYTLYKEEINDNL